MIRTPKRMFVELVNLSEQAGAELGQAQLLLGLLVVG